jgi:hypothetical protein
MSEIRKRHTELELACPHSLWRVGDKVLGKVTLNTTDHVMMGSVASLADDTESMVLHDGCATDSS